MRPLIPILTALTLSISQIAYAHNGADDGTPSPSSTHPAEHSPKPSDDNSPSSGRPGDDNHSEGWRKLRLISSSAVSGLRARVRSEDKRRESRVRAQIVVQVPNTSLGFTNNNDALAASYLIRFENTGQNTVTCALSADGSRETFPLQNEFALDLRSKSGVLTNRKGICIADGDATSTAVFPKLTRGTIATASIIVVGVSKDVASATLR